MGTSACLPYPYTFRCPCIFWIAFQGCRNIKNLGEDKPIYEGHIKPPLLIGIELPLPKMGGGTGDSVPPPCPLFVPMSLHFLISHCCCHVLLLSSNTRQAFVWLLVIWLRTLISLIKVGSTLTDSKNSTLHKKNPPSTFIDFLDFFHPPLFVY